MPPEDVLACSVHRICAKIDKSFWLNKYVSGKTLIFGFIFLGCLAVLVHLVGEFSSGGYYIRLEG